MTDPIDVGVQTAVAAAIAAPPAPVPDFGSQGAPAPAAACARAVLIAGCGVVGLPLAIEMAQDGRPVILCDFDRVTADNLRKQRFFRRHVGELKIVAAAELIELHAPGVRVSLLPLDARSLGVGFFLERVSCVAACVDGRGSEAFLARQASLAGLPYLRLATRGETRVADVTLVPAPTSSADPCGACSFDERDFELARARYHCGGAPDNPAAGALTHAEHGTLAAAIAADAWRRGELGPARMIRFTGGPEPRLETTRLSGSASCQVSTPIFRHGPCKWVSSGTSDVMTPGRLVEAACCELACGPEALACEADAPFCPRRVCRACGRTAPPAFYQHSVVPPACEWCGRPIEQCALPPAQEFGTELLRPVWDRTLRQLGAPSGVGLRFVSPGRGEFNVCVAPDPDPIAKEGAP